MAKVVCKCGVKRQKGYLYFIDKKGDVSKAKMARGKKKGGKPTKVQKCGIKKRSGYLYFVDKKGNAAEAKMVRGGRRKKKKKK
ncbi:MAG: hypothetical protein HQ593_03955 [Candidatus Omnitrophica bacterium]|nr:hypothetical protein [Candidatus Omnitrophota bacterium]